MQARTMSARIPCHPGFPVPIWLEAVANAKSAFAVRTLRVAIRMPILPDGGRKGDREPTALQQIAAQIRLMIMEKNRRIEINKNAGSVSRRGMCGLKSSRVRFGHKNAGLLSIVVA
jgi:hypothetical protein